MRLIGYVLMDGLMVKQLQYSNLNVVQMAASNLCNAMLPRGSVGVLMRMEMNLWERELKDDHLA